MPWLEVWILNGSLAKENNGGIGMHQLGTSVSVFNSREQKAKDRLKLVISPSFWPLRAADGSVLGTKWGTIALLYAYQYAKALARF